MENDSKGNIWANSSNPATVDILLGTMDVAVTLNGLTGYTSADVYIEANDVSVYTYYYTLDNESGYYISNFAVFDSNGEYMFGDAELNNGDQAHWYSSDLCTPGEAYGQAQGIGACYLEIEDRSESNNPRTRKWYIVGVTPR